jgi:methionyl-tRNA formyltransferase
LFVVIKSWQSEQNVVSNYCKKTHLPVHHWPYNLPADTYDLGVVVSFGKLIPEVSIGNCRLGMLNVHGSLLPALRGAAPIHRAILNGLPETGVTIMRLAAKKFDVGDILLQQPIALSEHVRTSQVYENMAKVGAQLLMRCLHNLPLHLAQARKQDDSQASFAPKIKESDAKIDWNEMSADRIYRMYRAFDLFVHLHCNWINGEQLLLYEMRTPEQTRSLNLDAKVAKYASTLLSDLKPGLLYYYKPERLICVRCANNEWVAFGAVSLKNYKQMSALQFHNGFISKLKATHRSPVILT